MIRELAPRCSIICLGMLAVSGILLVSGCGGRGKEDFILENPTTTTISAGDKEVEVIGYTFRFPEGGSGTLTVSKIVSGPKAPFPGEGLYVDYDGSDPMELVFHSTDDYLMVMGYGKVQGMFDDKIGNRERWFTLPWEELPDGRIAFDLTAVGVPQESGPAKAPAQKQQKEYRIIRHFWISKLPSASNEAEKRVLLGLQAYDYSQEFLNALSPERRSNVEARIRERPLTIEHDGNYYQGFWWRSLGRWGRIFRPTVHVTLDGFSLAHELGHYFTHLLVGDDVQSTLEGQASLFGEHGIREVVGRDVVLEEYAYFVEFFLKGTGGQYDLHRPYDMFRGLNPKTTDFPSLEGFGAAMLASLNRTSQTIKDITTGNLVDVPVIGLDYRRIFDIIAQGATDINQLRQNIMAALSTEEAEKFAILMGRMGWRYHGKGRLLDSNGNPLSGVTVEPLGKVGNKEYPTGLKATTDSKGGFTLDFIFPGKSYLRITQGRQVTDVPISVDWDLPTNKPVDLGDISITQKRVQDTRYITIYMSSRAKFSIKRYEYDSLTGEVRVDTFLVDWSPSPRDLDIHGPGFGNIPVTWSGNSFSAFAPDTHLGTWTFNGTVDETGQVLLSIIGKGQYLKTWYDDVAEREVTESKRWTIKAINVPLSPGGYSVFQDKVHFRYHQEDVSHVTMTYTRSVISKEKEEVKKEFAELIELTWHETEIVFSVEPLSFGPFALGRRIVTIL